MRALLKTFKPLKRHAPSIIQNWGHRLLVDLNIDPEPFRGFSDALRPTMMKIANTRFYRYEEHRAEGTRIPGWLSPKERQILYALGRWLPGPITEIGSWCGLSTTAIAHGIADSHKVKSFRTYDLRLSTDNFRQNDGTIGMFLPGDTKPSGTCSIEDYQQSILPIISAPGGSNAILRKHLDNLDLLDLTEIEVGDFKSFQPVVSSVIFCDALHDEHEIEINGPALRPWLRSGSILACHDIGGLPALVASLRKQIPLGHGLTIESIYLAEVET